MAPPFDLARAHRWFAIECNNQAWELIEREGGPGTESDQLVQMAHASVWHWGQVGTELNRLRGLVLLANAYLAAGRGAEALRYAAECLAMAEREEVGGTRFDRATAIECFARAHAIAGDAETARQRRAEAIELAAGLENEEERGVFDAILARGE